MLFYVLKILRWSILGCAGLLIIWTIGGNWLADRQAKEIKDAIADYKARYPRQETNDSTLELYALIARLGLPPLAIERNSSMGAYILTQSSLVSSEQEQQEWQKMSAELDSYLSEQLFQGNEAIAPPPESLQLYLRDRAEDLAAIENHILSNDPPQYYGDITPWLEGELLAAVPGFYGFIRLQKIFALDILENERTGNTEAAVKTLEASWKLNHFLESRYDLLASLVATISGKYSVGVIRKIDALPSEWQQRLQEYDLEKMMILELETFFLENVIFIYKYSSWSDEKIGFPYDPPLLQILRYLRPLSQPYFTFAAIDTWKYYQNHFPKAKQNNICFEESYHQFKLARWNLPGFIYTPNILGQLSKAKIHKLHLELTQQILKVKALARQQGQWPESIPDLESEICPGTTWIYQVTNDGQMSLSLSHIPKYVQREKQYEKESGIMRYDTLPLEYKTRKLPQL